MTAWLLTGLIIGFLAGVIVGAGVVMWWGLKAARRPHQRSGQHGHAFVPADGTARRT